MLLLASSYIFVLIGLTFINALEHGNFVLKARQKTREIFIKGNRALSMSVQLRLFFVLFFLD